MGSYFSFGKKRRGSDEDGAAPEKPDVLKISPWDAASMKRTLDERAPSILSEISGLQEDNSYGNLKIAIMAVSVAFGCVAQFYPIPFPDNIPLLAACVVVYFGLSGVLQYQTSYADRDFIWASKPEAGRPSVCVRCEGMEKGSDVVTFTVECPWGRPLGSVARSVGAFFTEAGEFSEGALARELKEGLLPLLTAADTKKRA